MVWALFPVDPLPGEDKHYIFTKGTYKVGRRGCDIIVNKDKGVSRIHAEIVVDAVSSLNSQRNKGLTARARVRLRDCSKYGTFVHEKKSKKNIHDLPSKETTITDGDLVSFGTGNATYRFCFVPFVLLVHRSEAIQANKSIEDKISSIGGHISYNLNPECTHVLVDENMEMKEDLIDAVIAKKPFVLPSWVELLAEKRIHTEIPSCGFYAPTVTLDGVSVKVADPKSRENSLKGFKFLMESTDTYKYKERLHSLMKVGGAEVLSMEGLCSTSQGSEDRDSNQVICVIPAGSTSKVDNFYNPNSFSRIKETDLVCAVISGHLDPSTLISGSVAVLISSSCSTDETIVADSDDEVETATTRVADVINSQEIVKTEGEITISTDHLGNRSEDSYTMSFRGKIDDRMDKVDLSECGNTDVIYSQELIVRDNNMPAFVTSMTRAGVLDFKRFRKIDNQSGNSFSNLIPFSKCPYKSSDYGAEEIAESIKEEKKRKQMEAVADDLFNNERGKRRGVPGSLHGLLSRG